MKYKFFHLFAAIALLPMLWGCPNAPEPEDPDVLEPIQASYNIGADGGEFTISVKTNTTLSVQSNASWISVPTKTKAATTQTVKLVAEANTTTEARTGKVTVRGGSLSAVIEITQAGREKTEDPYIELPQAVYTIDAGGGFLNIDVLSNVKYSVSSDKSWAKPNGARVDVDPNPGKEERRATITYSYEGISKTTTVRQLGEEDVLTNAGKSTYNVPYTGGEIEVKVSSNVDYTATPSADWITQVKTRTVTTDILKFTVAANEGAARTATIDIVFNEALSFSVSVSQNAYIAPSEDDPYLEVSPEYISTDEYGGDVTVHVNANFDYNVDIDADWLSIVSKGAACIINVAPNPSEAERSTMVMIDSEGLQGFVTIFQEGKGSSLDPFDVGENLSAKGTANCYVVTKAGNYTFDASVMGNGPQGFIWTDEDAAEQNLWPTEKVSVSFENYYGSERPKTVQVLWDDAGVINNVSMDEATQVVSFTATGAKGNALIAIYSGQKQLLWSWHIWCTDSPARLRHEAEGISIVMLDRNLGATSANPADGTATFGYWYQFGRKDPLKLFDGVARSMVPGEVSMQASVENPQAIYRIVGKDTEWFNGSVESITADLWGNPIYLHNGKDHAYQAPMSELRKTIYDPCPPGYMVPPEWAWVNYSLDDCTVGTQGITLADENGESFYPYAGFGDEGDTYGGDSGWYGWPGFTPNKSYLDGKWHHNLRNVVCCWSSGSEDAFLRSGHVWDKDNYHHANMFMYMQDEEASGNDVLVNENSAKHLYTKYGHIRQRVCSVRCMRVQ